MGIHQHGKSISIKDLLVKIARREQLEITEGDATPFSMYATSWLERKKATLARSTYGDYRSIRRFGRERRTCSRGKPAGRSR